MDKGLTFQGIIQEMSNLQARKDADYSGEEPLSNFCEAERIGVPAYTGAFIRLQDKYMRLCNMLRGAEANVADETIEDTLLDMANYAVITLALYRLREEIEDEQSKEDELGTDGILKKHLEDMRQYGKNRTQQAARLIGTDSGE